MTTLAPERVTYADVLRVPEFRAMFAADVLSVFGDQVARIAVAVLVYTRTGSAFAASATYALSFLTWFVGGPVLSAAADRYPRRTVMVVCDVGRLLLVLAMCAPGVPLWAFFLALVGVGLLTPPFEAARSGLVADIVTGELYVAANGLTQTLAQAGQVGGFLAGGLLVAGLGPRGALLADAATFGISAALVLSAVARRPAPQSEPASFLSDTRSGLALVFGSPELRRLLGYAAVTMAALIAPEGLAVPLAAESGHGAVTAGVLMAAGPAGFVVGAALLVRVDTARRRALLPRLAVLACTPLLLTPFVGPPALLAGVWLLAGAGGALQVIANAAFVAAVPPELRGRAYGVASTTLMTVQGGTLLLVGAAAQALGARWPVAIAAAVVLLVLPTLRGTKGVVAQGSG